MCTATQQALRHRDLECIALPQLLPHGVLVCSVDSSTKFGCPQSTVVVAWLSLFIGSLAKFYVIVLMATSSGSSNFSMLELFGRKAPHSPDPSFLSF